MFAATTSPLVFADVGKRPDAVHVADRSEALACAQVLVKRDPVRVGLDADRNGLAGRTHR
jgi:hypothetical protein